MYALYISNVQLRKPQREKEKKKKVLDVVKMKKKINATVIPAPRKSVKRMMFEAMVGFLSRLCFTSEQDLRFTWTEQHGA